MSWDESILRGFYLLASENELLGNIAFYAAQYLGHLLLALLVAYLFTHKKGVAEGFRDVFVVLATAGIVWTLVYVYKEFFPSPRPFVVLPDIIARIDANPMDSLPSGHATFFAALAVSMLFYHRFVGLFLVAGALVIGWARIAVGIHWPSDILVGFAIGAALAVVVHVGLTMMLKRFGFVTHRDKFTHRTL